jgi:hypothetical protein
MVILGLGASSTDEERAVVVLAMNQAEGAVRRYLGYDPVQTERTEYYPQSNFNHGSQTVWEANESSAYMRSVNEAWSSELQVQHIPIRAITAMDLRIDYDGRSGTKSGAFAASTQKVEGVDFWPNYQGVDAGGYKICRDGIIRSIGLWPTEAGSVQIKYTGGYSQDEFRGQVALVDASPIWEAVLSETVRRAKSVFLTKKDSVRGWVSGPLQSESLGDYSYSLGGGTGNSNALFGLGSASDLSTDTKEKLASFINYGYALGG